MSEPAFTAFLLKQSPRFREWLDALRTTIVPIKSPVPETATLEGVGVRKVYELDVPKLSADQVDRIVSHLARKFKADPATVRSHVAGEIGLPILAEDVVVAFSSRFIV
jgi:hypothetical protein